jgi:4-methyl-5(b-hydroxyethyl)-thiazole monophosphate biosynthesis
MMVVIPLANGFEEIEAVSLIDVLRRAEIDVIVAGVGAKMISGAHEINIETDRLISQISSDEMEMIILPGGWDGTHALADDADVQRLLKEMDTKGKMIGAICAAPYALEKAGVLKHDYTCYPSVEKQIRLDGYTKEQRVVTDGNIMTSSGPGTSLCFALEIVKRLKGVEVAKALKKGMLIDFC